MAPIEVKNQGISSVGHVFDNRKQPLDEDLKCYQTRNNRMGGQERQKTSGQK